jgi:DNA (cytosine-5)-methyltransferase 1
MRSLELFSGAGGLARGLERAGFEHASFVELNKHACETLHENFDRNKVFFGDIRKFNFDSVGAVDIVAGGPPCQPFSLGGKHKANQDDRDMFPYAIKAIERLSPRAFLFENVKGLLRESFSDYFDYIILRLTYPSYTDDGFSNWQEHLESLRKIGKNQSDGLKYKVQYRLVNAADYGVPQTRERVIIVGTRSDLASNWSFPAPTHSADRLLWDLHLSGEYWDRLRVEKSKRPIADSALREKVARLKDAYGMFEPNQLAWRTVRDALHDIPDPRIDHGIPDHAFKDGARSYPGHTGSEYDWPSKTIKAGGHGVPGGENMIRFSDGSIRYFTVFEAKRIQTFPVDFVIKGAWSEAMRQIGNAVPVLLGEVIGSSIAAALVGQDSNKQF